MSQHQSERPFTLNNMPAIQLDFLVEAIAKALCFEKYVALTNAEDPDDIDIESVLLYFEEHEHIYINKAHALLIMLENSDQLLNETVH
jgi:hypothetical protein